MPAQPSARKKKYEDAVIAIQDGETIRNAAEAFGLGREALRLRLHGRSGSQFVCINPDAEVGPLKTAPRMECALGCLSSARSFEKLRWRPRRGQFRLRFQAKNGHNAG
ncbi:hypothetical protein FI667_g1937, partial [Globisporangium splendens]